MIKVKVFSNDNGSISGLEVSGHAGFASYGYDIVCAGVSALVETCVLGLERIAGLSNIALKKEGYFYLKIPEDLPKEVLDKALIILETTYLGIEDMAKSYPANICVKRNGRCKI